VSCSEPPSQIFLHLLPPSRSLCAAAGVSTYTRMRALVQILGSRSRPTAGRNRLNKHRDFRTSCHAPLPFGSVLLCKPASPVGPKDAMRTRSSYDRSKYAERRDLR
jgi:hypothetical protein